MPDFEGVSTIYVCEKKGAGAGKDEWGEGARNGMGWKEAGKEKRTRPVKVHPGTSRCTFVFVSLKSKLRCSARALTAALDALYAAFPGGLVMPCLLPVMTIALGLLLLEERA